MPLLVLPFPAFNPILFELGPISIRWYGIAYVAGLVFGWWYIRKLVETDRLWENQKRPTATDIDDLLVWMTLGVVLGGRLGYILFYNFNDYLAHPLEIFKTWHGGMSVHGGFIGTAIAQILYARRRGLNFLTVFDLAAVAVPVGLFLGRLANFVNGELYGRVTDVPWAFVFPNSDGMPRHPSQLYEAALEGVLLFALLTPLVWKAGLLKRPGLATGIFGLVYAAARILVETVREPDAQVGFLAGGFLTMGMLLSVLMAIVAIAFILLALSGRTRSETPA
ncbi:prolipoprotein diacylglyceryl transferase [Oryzibacter oryziterrae]|uniref:prolipoprotein diacylglyceryl transferase n=1 Tax=Oryzibacter oryziterrae TaxID=2766474 RepID=UPI001F008E6C|nr:prolipoprotein diacylglyceryl transferase [Oryzibacter oryziterrae]